MKLTLLPVAILVLTVGAVADAQSIYGSFQDCPFHCRTIKINRNHTFLYRLNGDLYNDERHSGTWTLVGRNKLHASSRLNRSRLQVMEQRGNQRNDYSIIVLDVNGAVRSVTSFESRSWIIVVNTASEIRHRVSSLLL
jgi:hypothetical protein